MNVDKYRLKHDETRQNGNLIKFQLMKKVEKRKNGIVPDAAIDPSLNKYQNKILFPKKLALVNEQLKGAKLPSKKHHS